MERHTYLAIDEYHLAHTDAWNMVVGMLQARAVKMPTGGWSALVMSWTQRGGKVAELSFDRMVEQARRTGVVAELQGDVDGADYVFGASHALPVPQSGSGHDLKLKAEFAGFVKELSVPCRYAAIESERVEDVLAHRAAACRYSDADDLVETCRSFRAYVHACVDVVEAFIHRYLLVYGHTRTKVVDASAFRGLRSTEARVAFWLETFSAAQLEDIEQSHQWYEFSRLLRVRDEIVHGRRAFLGHNVRDLARELNYVREGVGGLMHLMRLLEGQGSLGFIERLRSAPRVTFSLPHARHAVLR